MSKDASAQKKSSFSRLTEAQAIILAGVITAAASIAATLIATGVWPSDGNNDNGDSSYAISTAVAATQTAMPKHLLLDFEDLAGWEIKQEGEGYAVLAAATPYATDEVILDGHAAIKAELSLQLNQDHQARFFLTKHFPFGSFQADRIVIPVFWPESQGPALTYALICINTVELTQYCEELQDFSVKRWNTFDVDLTSVPFRDTFYSEVDLSSLYIQGHIQDTENDDTATVIIYVDGVEFENFRPSQTE